jgi:predicted permease
MIINTMPDIIEIVLPAFFAIFVGYLVGKFSRINMAPVVDITLYIGVPALAFVSLLDKEIVLVDAAKMWASSLIIMLGCLVIAWLVFKLIRQKHSGLYVPISMMNTVNLPFPIIYLAYGAEGLTAATLFYIPNVILIYSLGVYIMAGKHWKDNVKEVLRQPVVYAAVLGLSLNFLSIKVPALVYDSLDFIAQMAIPLALQSLPGQNDVFPDDDISLFSAYGGRTGNRLCHRQRSEYHRRVPVGSHSGRGDAGGNCCGNSGG